MANKKHLERLKGNLGKWNEWRAQEGSEIPDLSGADFSGADLRGVILTSGNLSGVRFADADLSFADLSYTNLSAADFENASLVNAKFSSANLSRATLRAANLLNADLKDANLLGADLSDTDLTKANLSGARLRNTILSHAELAGADFYKADLTSSDLTDANCFRVDFSNANLTGVNFLNAKLNETNFSSCKLWASNFAKVDLSRAKGLEQINHRGPSSIGIDTLYLSKGKIPDLFLRGCGVPDDFINYMPSLIGATQVIQFYSCFISYSTQDEEFAKRLHARMQAAKLRVWFAPEDMKGGNIVIDQIDKAIRVYDKLLLVVSQSSMKSKWVSNEIMRALKAEKTEGRRKLFPIRLVSFDTLAEWEHVTSTGEDVAEEIRRYFIPDFSGWKDHDSFEAAFERLIRDLKADAT